MLPGTESLVSGEAKAQSVYGKQVHEQLERDLPESGRKQDNAPSAARDSGQGIPFPKPSWESPLALLSKQGGFSVLFSPRLGKSCHEPMPLIPPGADQLKTTFLRNKRGRGRDIMSRGRSRGPFLSSSLGHHYHFYFVALFFCILSALQPTADPWPRESNPGPSRAGIPRQLCPCNPSIPNPSCHKPTPSWPTPTAGGRLTWAEERPGPAEKTSQRPVVTSCSSQTSRV